MPSASPVHRVDFLGSAPVVAAHAALPERRSLRARAAAHDYAAVLLLTTGQARLEQRGEWSLSAGDALLVPAGEPHRLLETRGAEYWGVGFRAPCFAGTSASALLEPLERVRDGAAAVVRVPTARQDFLQGLLRELEQVTATPAKRGVIEQTVQLSLLSLILAELGRAAAPLEPSVSMGGTGGVVVESLRFIERHCLGPLSLAQVARAVGRSPAYVTAALSKATGRSAGDWIVSGRMAEARRLLLHSDERVERIAERVGYADATHFIRMFRRTHGATPAAWRTAASDRSPSDRAGAR